MAIRTGPGGYTRIDSDARFYAAAVPSDHNFLAWSAPLTETIAGSAMSVEAGAGTLRLSRNRRVPDGNITNVVFYLTVAGSTLTSGQCFASLYNASTGALVGQTADQATAWQSAGLKTMALAGGPYAVVAGDYYVGFWYNGTTAPTVMRSGLGDSASQMNAGITGSNFNFAIANASLTTTAPPTLGAKSASAIGWWTAVS